MTVVQGLWVKGPLSRIERLSIESFVRNGHEYHLYTYDDSEYRLPPGAIQKDAGEIVPRDKVWQHGFGEEAGSLAGFSDYFRFTLLFEKGGIWADADLVCLRPLSVDRPLYISAETARPGIEQPSTQLLKFPKGDDLLKRAIEYIESQDPGQIEFLQVGPRLIHRLVDEMGYGAHVLPAKVANPVPWWQYYVMFLGEHAPRLSEMQADPDVCCVHLWNEMIRRLEIPKDASLDPQSPIERLCARYAVSRPDPVSTTDARMIRARMLFAEATSEFDRETAPAFGAGVWQEVIDLDPGYHDVYRRLAMLCAGAEDLAELERRIDAAPGEIATHPLVMIDLSRAHARVGSPETSDRLLDLAARHALERLPSMIGSVFLERFRRRDLARIEDLFAALPEEVKAQPDVLFAVARTRFARSDYDDALRIGERVIALDPRYLNGHTLVAEILLKLGRADEAERHAIMATEAWPRPWPWKVLGRIYLAKGLQDEARAAFLKCREFGGDDRAVREALDVLPNRSASAG